MTDREKKVFRDALLAFGMRSRIELLFEEMSELQKEFCKFLRGKSNFDQISEEMADVEIMLDQLRLFLGNDEEIQDWRKRKVERLKGLIASQK